VGHDIDVAAAGFRVGGRVERSFNKRVGKVLTYAAAGEAEIDPAGGSLGSDRGKIKDDGPASALAEISTSKVSWRRASSMGT